MASFFKCLFWTHLLTASPPVSSPRTLGLDNDENPDQVTFISESGHPTTSVWNPLRTEVHRGRELDQVWP